MSLCLSVYAIVDGMTAPDRDSFLAFRTTTTTTTTAVPHYSCGVCAGGVVLKIREEDVVVVFLILFYLLHRFFLLGRMCMWVGFLGSGVVKGSERGAVKVVEVGDEDLLWLRREMNDEWVSNTVKDKK